MGIGTASPTLPATCPDTAEGYPFGIDMNDTAPRLSWRFVDALKLSADLHAHQKRKGTDIPYISHLLGVASIALDHGADEEQAIAALLHDSIEDAPTTLGPDWVRRTIQHRFGPRVMKIVHLASQDGDVLLVSASDKLHNATAILKDHREIGDDLWARFNTEAGKAGTIGYYRSLVNAYRATGHHPRLVAELDAVVSRIEHEAGHGAGGDSAVGGVWVSDVRRPLRGSCYRD